MQVQITRTKAMEQFSVNSSSINADQIKLPNVITINRMPKLLGPNDTTVDIVMVVGENSSAAVAM
jgi:hypothetical protein